MSVLTAFLEQLFNGLTIGIVYVLLAAGLSLIFGVMNVINFAHGELFALGAYFALAVVGVQALQGLPLHAFWIALLLAPVVVAIVGGVIELSIIRPLYDRNPLYHILLTFGLVLIFKDILESQCCSPYFVLFRGSGSTTYPSLPDLITGQFSIGGVTLPLYNVFVVVFGSFIALGTWWLLNNTKTGVIIRAGAEDRRMVRELGIDIDRYYTLVFAFGTALAAVAGIVLAGRQGLNPTMGDSVILPAFVIVVLGGLGSFRGAIVGGLLVGIIQTMFRSPPVFAQYIPDLEGLVVFLLMIGILLVRPQGIYGSSEPDDEEGDLLTTAGRGVLSQKWRRRLGIGLVVVLFLIPFGIGTRFNAYTVNSLLVNMLIWALFALSLDFVMGYAGLVSLGHVLFWGLGGYTAVLVAQGKIAGLFAATPIADLLSLIGYSDSIFFALGTGIVVAAVLAWVVGYLSIRVSGVYFAMITLGFAELFHQGVLKLDWTGSSDGLTGGTLEYALFGVKISDIFGFETAEFGSVVLTDGIVVGNFVIIGGEVSLFYYFVLISVVGSYLVANRIMDATFGSVLQAIRESEERASFLGYDTTAYKRQAFVVSGALAGLAGGLQATTGLVIGVSDSFFFWLKSGEVLVATILGGMGTLYGPMIGAGLYIGAEEFLISYTEQWQAAMGVLFVLFVLFVPRGLVSIPRLLVDRFDLDVGRGGGSIPSAADSAEEPQGDD